MYTFCTKCLKRIEFNKRCKSKKNCLCNKHSSWKSYNDLRKNVTDIQIGLKRYGTLESMLCVDIDKNPDLLIDMISMYDEDEQKIITTKLLFISCLKNQTRLCQFICRTYQNVDALPSITLTLRKGDRIMFDILWKEGIVQRYDSELYIFQAIALGCTETLDLILLYEGDYDGFCVQAAAMFGRCDLICKAIDESKSNKKCFTAMAESAHYGNIDILSVVYENYTEQFVSHINDVLNDCYTITDDAKMFLEEIASKHNIEVRVP